MNSSSRSTTGPSSSPVSAPKPLTLKRFARAKSAHLIAKVEERMAAAADRGADEESVHDLRTSIRRLSECLRAFEALYPLGEAGRLRRKLRKLMQLAAEVRNRDIAGELFVKAGLASDDTLFVRLNAEKHEWQSALTDKIVAWTEKERAKQWRGIVKAK